MTFDLLIRAGRFTTATARRHAGPMSASTAGAIATVEPSLEGASAADRRRGDGPRSLPGLRRPARAYGACPVRRPAALPKIGQGFTTEVINPDGLAPAPVDPARAPSAARTSGPSRARGPRVALVDGDRVPRRTRRDRAGDVARAVGRARCRARLRPRRSGRGADRAAAQRDAPSGSARSRRGGEDALVRPRLPPRSLRRTPKELVAVAPEAAAVGAPLVPHVRNEGAGLLDAVREMVGVARTVGAPLHVSHLKSLADERLVEPLLTLLEEAADDLDVSFDQYPYGAGSTLLASVLPGWAQEGGASATLARCVRAASTCPDRARRRGRAARVGEPARDARARVHRDRARGTTERGGGRLDARGDRRHATVRPRGRGPRPARRLGARRDDDPPLRLRRRGAADRGAPPPARRLRRDLRRSARIHGSTERRRDSSAASPSATACSRRRRPSRGSPGGRPTVSVSPIADASHRASAPISCCSTPTRFVDTATYGGSVAHAARASKACGSPADGSGATALRPANGPAASSAERVPLA